jgi:hypothetical protein
MNKVWTRTDGKVRVEPIGNIPMLVNTNGADNATCPECGQYNAMLPNFGVNDLATCRNCNYLSRVTEDYGNPDDVALSNIEAEQAYFDSMDMFSDVDF